MRTANNNSNFTVENLVAKYRNYVAENCPKEYYCDDYQDEYGKWHTSEGYIPFSPDGDAEEQLIITLYNAVAGNSADKSVQDALSKYAEKFYVNALTEDEFSFLCANLKEAVSISLSHLREHKPYLGLEAVPPQVIDIIKENTTIRNGSTVFVADSCIGDVTTLFAGCIVKGYTFYEETYHSELWALAQIRLYALKISSMILKNREGCAEDSYLADVDLVVWGSARFSVYEDVVAVYNAVKPGTKMILFMDKNYAAGEDNPTYGIRKKLVEDHAIKSIISFEYTDDEYNVQEEEIVLIIEKSAQESVHIKNGQNGEILDIPTELLDHELLWPSFYSTKRPYSGIPLSDIVTSNALTFADLTDSVAIECDGDWILPDEAKGMSVAVPVKMAQEYKDANLLSKNLDLAGNELFDQWKTRIRALKEPCVLLYGNKEKTVVGYIRELPKTGIATLGPIARLVPKEGIDVRYVAALLLTPEVKSQIESICQGSINDSTFPLIINKVLIPNHSEKERVEFLSEANYEALLVSQEEREQEQSNYTRAIRMRKHSLTQSLSSVEAMFYALNSYRKKHGVLNNEDVISRVKKTTVHEAFEFISQGLKDLMPALEHIAEVEYTFEKPEWIDPEKFIEDYIQKNEKGWLNFKPIVTWEHGHNQAVEDLKNPVSGELIIRKGGSLNLFLFPKDALERVFKNIISNAKAHGFVDKSRNDYQVRFSWHTDGMSLTIEIENNGSPIPSDRDTASLLEYGVSTDLHNNGHNGIGCNEINDIMKRYDGKIEIVSMPGNEYSVKYILTFNRYNNIVRTFKL